MARPLRVEYAGAYYHVINRGNNQEKIFKTLIFPPAYIPVRANWYDNLLSD